MTKSEAIALFGGVRELACALAITRQAIYQWNEELPPATQDRVRGAAVRLRVVAHARRLDRRPDPHPAAEIDPS